MLQSIPAYTCSPSSSALSIFFAVFLFPLVIRPGRIYTQTLVQTIFSRIPSTSVRTRLATRLHFSPAAHPSTGREKPSDNLSVSQIHCIRETTVGTMSNAFLRLKFILPVAALRDVSSRRLTSASVSIPLYL